MLGKKDGDLAMDLDVVKIMQTIHMDYMDEVYIKCFFKLMTLLEFSSFSNGSSSLIGLY